MKLRDYQLDLLHQIRGAWAAGEQNVLAVLPTGAGKTIIFTRIAAEHDGPVLCIAHRQELVGQISVALGRHGVRHRIIGPKSMVRYVTRLQMLKLGASYYDARAAVGVASVDTLVRSASKYKSWLDTITLWIQDEAHHVLRSNKWGRVLRFVPNAIGLGVTATPTRADGRGLGRHVDGVFDALVEGPPMRAIIDRGYLTDYRVFAPRARGLDLSAVTTSATGDYSKPQLKAAIQRSRIVGDAVEHYQNYAAGLLGITFATDVETSTQIAQAYREVGVPAEVVSHKTTDEARTAILRRFEAREILQLVNVDLFGEGFDLPAIEVCTFARPTQSYALYAQQFGRGLRLMDNKSEAIIIDMVDNVVRHGLPDARRVWTLDARERRSERDPHVIPVRVCPECTGPYERFRVECPYCGFVPTPVERRLPDQVDGDLVELDAETLARLRGDIGRVDMSAFDYREQLLAKRCPAAGLQRNIHIHLKRQEMQTALRASMAWFGGIASARGRTERETQREFYHRFGVDVLSAQSLDKTEAKALADRINTYLGEVEL